MPQIDPTGGTPILSKASGAAGQSPTTQEDQDRFLKLLTAQMQNQDPLNPMDNAQVTSQMAQISTVSGISQLNATLSELVKSQQRGEALSASSLIGKRVYVQSNKLSMNNGVASGHFSLDGRASNVSVEILDKSGRVIDTVPLGNKDAGVHEFQRNVRGKTSSSDLTFRVRSAKASGVLATATSLMTGVVSAVSLSAGGAGKFIFASGQEAPLSSLWRLQ